MQAAPHPVGADVISTLYLFLIFHVMLQSVLVTNVVPTPWNASFIEKTEMGEILEPSHFYTDASDKANINDDKSRIFVFGFRTLGFVGMFYKPIQEHHLLSPDNPFASKELLWYLV